MRHTPFVGDAVIPLSRIGRPTNQRPRGATMGDRPTNQPTNGDRPWTDHGPVSIEEAASRLGITPNAVRQRLKRHTLDGHKTPAGWVVVWPPTKTAPATDQTTTIDVAWSATDQPTNRPTDHDKAAVGVVSPAAQSQLEAIRDQWLMPLVERVGELEREVGRLDAEREGVARDRDRLAEQVASDRGLADQLVNDLERERAAAVLRAEEAEERLRQLTAGDIPQDAPVAAQDAHHATVWATVVGDPPPQWRRWWRRLTEGL